MDPSRSMADFYEFYRQHRPWSRSLMRRALTGTGSDWEDHWNQAWAKFSQNYLNPAFVFKVSPEAYLRRILANQVIDALRQWAREARPQLLSEQDEPLEDIPGAGRSVPDIADGQALAELSPADWQDPLLAAAITRLSPMQRAVILFWAWRQPPPADKEIGEEFGISPSSAKTHRSRALDALRGMLEIERLGSPGTGEEIT
jgi:DNA-directed RNA polymerase specialized sigma24 family protein